MHTDEGKLCMVTESKWASVCQHCPYMTAESVTVYFTHSELSSRRSSLTAYCCVPLHSFNFWFITFIIFYIGLSPTFLSKATPPPCTAEGKNSLLVWRLPALQFKNPLSCNVLANESGQPLNKNCQFLFGLIGQCRDLAGRQEVSSMWVLILI